MFGLRGRFALLAAALAAVGLMGGIAISQASKSGGAEREHRLTNCMFLGPIGVKPVNEAMNMFYPDSGAHYFASGFHLPTGARLILSGDYPHARYFSFTGYGPNAVGQQAPGIHDTEITPNHGSTNPFLPGANRDATHRAYRVTVRPVARPANPQPNTLYLGSPGSSDDILVLRVYVPDRGQDPTGGVGLPKFQVRLASGRTLGGEAACRAIGANAGGRIPIPTVITPEQWTSLRDAPGAPVTWPARNPADWHTEYNAADIICRFFTPTQCSPNPTRTAGPFANPDNAYMATYVNRDFGHDIVVTGKMPTVPKTHNGEAVMGSGQLRYWALCDTQSEVTRITAGCLSDYQVPLSRGRRYTILLSLPSDRPPNATKACGVAYLPLSPVGDGVGDLDLSELQLRNLLAAPSFHHAIQDTKTPGDEAKVLGPYLPRIHYMSTRAFEKGGCQRGGS